MTGYLKRYLVKFGDIRISDHRQNRRNPASEIVTFLYPTTGETSETHSELGSAGFAGTSHKKSVVFLTAWPPRPRELASWRIERRQRWGELANQLQDQGLAWNEAERRAFDIVKATSDT
jgi:hypothetical protein